MEYRNGPSKGTAGIRGKDDEKKLFVGGLPKPCTEKDLKDTFAKFGEIESVHIKIDPYTGLSRGFCFIVFSDPNAVDTILSAGDININGKNVDPRKVTKSTIPGKLFVGGLTPDFTEDHLKDYFGQYGTITEIQWPIDKQKNQKKAFCFLTFANRDSVTELLKTPKQTVNGRELDVKKVKFNPETMWAQGPMGAYAARRAGSYPTTYSYAYPGYTYDYSTEYAAYDDYYSYEYPDAYYYDSAGYEAYAPTYGTAGYGTRTPRGQRPATYTRHAPY